MRHLLLGWVSLLLLTISGCCCDLKKESYAAVPLTLDDAKKQAKESGAELSIERRTRRMGSAGGCGHSAVCVILLPVILYDAVFPETWDEVTLRKGDEVLLVADYEKNGSLIHAQHVKDGVVLETRSIELKALGKKVYVDSAKLIDGKREPLPLSSQHDFIGDEKKALERTTDPMRRAEYISEAALLLESEGVAFAKERLLAPDEPERSRAEVVRLGCAGPREGFAPLLETAGQSPGAWVKLRLVGCYESESPARADALSMAMRAACEGAPNADLLEALARDHQEEVRGELALQTANACPAGAQRALFQLWLKHPVATEELTALLSSDATAKLAWKSLDSSQANQRAAIVKIIVDDGDGAARLLVELRNAQTVLEPELVEALARRFVKRNGLLEVGDRHETLSLFAQAAAQEDGVARTKPARAVISAAIASEKDAKHKATLEAVLVVLGDKSRVRAALPCAKGDPLYAGDYPSLDEDVCVWALLKHGGCTATGKVLSCP
jgi:hypothetical protein